MKYFAKLVPVEGEIKEGDYYRVKGTDKVLRANKHFKEIDQSLLEKVKLFIYSRDIQVGDKYTSVYKIIGEISPDATWVKEGDEFDEDEILACFQPGGEGSETWNLVPWDKMIIKPEDRHNFYTMCKVKGPCGHFH